MFRLEADVTGKEICLTIVVILIAIGAIVGLGAWMSHAVHPEDLPGPCDYCRVEREHVFYLPCEKCQKSHRGCKREQGLIHQKWHNYWFDCPRAEVR